MTVEVVELSSSLPHALYNASSPPIPHNNPDPQHAVLEIKSLHSKV